MDPSTTPQAAPAAAPTTTAPAPTAATVPADVSERLATFEQTTLVMQRQMQTLLDENKALKDESASRRIAARQAEQAAAEAAAKAGDVDGLRKALEMTQAELKAAAEAKAALEPLARQWQEFEQTEAQRVAEKAKALSPEFAELFADASTLAAKKKVLAAFEKVAARTAAQPSPVGEPPKQPSPLAPPAGAPPGTPPPQLSLATASVEELQALQRRDPKAHAQLLSTSATAPLEKPSWFSRKA